MTSSRGQSEIIGMVLLIGLVLVGSATIVVLGASVLSNAEEGTSLESASLHLQELDTRLETLAEADAEPRTEFDAAGTLAEDFRIERDGFINVTVDRNVTCSFQHNFTSIVFEDSRGRTVGYEAGGVWRGGTEGSTGLTPPDVTFEEGTLDVRLVNLTGTFDQATNVARLNATATQNRTQFLRQSVRQGECVRPDNLTIRVNSRYQTGWRNYLQSEVGLPPSNVTTHQNGTVIAYMGQGFLHPSADDRTNNVINFAEAKGVDVPYMEDATLDGSVPVTVMVDKPVSPPNTYSAFVEPLTAETLDIGRTVSLSDVNVTVPPRDVVVVLDDSGSMSGTKLQNAKIGASHYIGTLNASKDRAAVVSYDDEARYLYVDEGGQEVFFSNDLDEVNNSIDSAIANGTTRIDLGVEHMNAVFDLKSTQTTEKFAVLLTDGENICGGCPANTWTEQAADIAAARGITLHTIGYGPDSDLNETLLKLVANKTGGNYCQANSASAVIQCFEEAGNKSFEAIVQTPITSNVSTSGGQLFDADIPGNTSHIASVTAGSGTFLNVNDPTAPTLFSHSFALEDTENAFFNLTKYDCAAGAWEATGQTRTVNGNTMPVARCTKIGPQNGSFEATMYIDGDRPRKLLQTSYKGWQRDVNQSLKEFDTVDIDSSTGVLEAQSNHALLVFDLPPQGSGTFNTLTLLVQVGLSEQEAAGQDIVSVRVAEAELD